VGRFRILERHNELGYLEKRVVLYPDSDEERQFLNGFEVMFKWGSSVERAELGSLVVVAMVPIPGAAPGRPSIEWGVK